MSADARRAPDGPPIYEDDPPAGLLRFDARPVRYGTEDGDDYAEVVTDGGRVDAWGVYGYRANGEAVWLDDYRTEALARGRVEVLTLRAARERRGDL